MELNKRILPLPSLIGRERLVRVSVFVMVMVSVFVTKANAEVALKSENRDTAYVAKIIDRAQKNISAVQFADSATWEAVRNIVANRYFELNDIYAERDTTKAIASRTLTGAAKNKEIDAAKALCDSKLYRSHFAFTANLSLYINEEQIEQVKDGITMGVVNVTYKANCDMIPSLKEEEKAQILAWLKEARELALDAESSKKKHDVFGKYKGRINNYLSKRGYDLVAERKEWYKRMDAAGIKY